MSDNSVTAVILAAGEGRRLEPLTNRRPKPMVPVANRPLLEHVVEAVAAAGIDRIAPRRRVQTGAYSEPLRRRRRLGRDDRVRRAVDATGNRSRRLAGRVRRRRPLVVLNGDRIVDAAVVSQVRDLARDGDHPAMAVTTAEHPREYGVVTLDGDRVTGIDEKPEGPVETNRINAGVYAFSPAVFDAIRETHTTGELAITATLNELASAGDLTAVGYDGRWLDVSNLWDLLTVNAALIGESEQTGPADPPASR